MFLSRGFYLVAHQLLSLLCFKAKGFNFSHTLEDAIFTEDIRNDLTQLSLLNGSFMKQTDHFMALNKAENTLLQQRLNRTFFKDSKAFYSVIPSL